MTVTELIEELKKLPPAVLHQPVKLGNRVDQAAARVGDAVNALEEGIRIDIFYGSVKLESRFRPEVDRLIGEGRAWHFDANGKLVKDTGWEPTGVILTWG